MIKLFLIRGNAIVSYLNTMHKHYVKRAVTSFILGGNEFQMLNLFDRALRETSYHLKSGVPFKNIF